MDDLIRSTADSKFVLKICIPTSYFQELIESRCSTYIQQKYRQKKLGQVSLNIINPLARMVCI
jgi:hypothetical protein